MTVGYILLFIFMLFSDIVSKNVVSHFFEVGEGVPVIKDVFHITYVRNFGAAFSMLSGYTWIISAVTAMLLIGIAVYIIVKKPKSHTILLSLTMILAGGTGKLYDRLKFGYVRDFFDARIINFAVFNVADIFVVVGTALLAVYLLFFDGKKE